MPGIQQSHPDTNAFRQVALWFARHCDGDWEHGDGITITTLDNPGWLIHISLENTELEGRALDRHQIDRSDSDWLHAWIENHTFNAACGLPNIEEALRLFLDWAADGTSPTGTV